MAKRYKRACENIGCRIILDQMNMIGLMYAEGYLIREGDILLDLVQTSDGRYICPCTESLSTGKCKHLDLLKRINEFEILPIQDDFIMIVGSGAWVVDGDRFQYVEKEGDGWVCKCYDAREHSTCKHIDMMNKKYPLNFSDSGSPNDLSGHN